SLRPVEGANDPGARRAEVLMFNCGGSGARPGLDGMSATAFPSGVMTMPVEAVEQTGPVIIWQKELRPDSGGAGTHRGGLGQNMQIGAADGYRFDFSAMFDRVHHPARGREGGQPGGATRFTLSDGTEMQGKGRQAIPPGARAVLALPGGGGYGPPGERTPEQIRRDLDLGYVSAEAARRDYGYEE
ncbi:MAG: hydantoinase B/oxoprolinase family protein, partial [Pseudomonadota bacterium]